MIGHGVWQRRFGGETRRRRRADIDRRWPRIAIEAAYTVVGVLPSDFRFTYPRVSGA